MMGVLRELPYVLVAAVVLVLAGRRRRGSHRVGSPRGLRSRRAGPPPEVPGATHPAREPFLGVVGLVAAREVRQRLRGRAFRIATVVVLVGVGAAIVIPVVTRGTARAQRVGVVGSPPGSVRSGILAAASSVGTTVRLVGEASRHSADDDLRSGRIDVAVTDASAVVVDKAIGSNGTSITAQLARAMSNALATTDAIAAAGLTPAQAARLAAAAPLPVRSLQPAAGNAIDRGTAITGLIVLFVMLTQYLVWTLIGVMEEKSNRVVEVLLAAVRPLQLLSGKLLGIGIVVFAQATLIAAFGLALGKVVGSDLLHGSAPFLLASMLTWLVLGYAFYSWVYAAAGSMAERQDQVQSLTVPLTLPILFGYLVAFSAIGAGHPSTLVEVLAYLPPTAPFAMPVLVAARAVVWWQFAVSAAISVVCTIAAAKLAATVYRRAILQTGRRVRFRDVLNSAVPASQPGGPGGAQ